MIYIIPASDWPTLSCEWNNKLDGWQIQQLRKAIPIRWQNISYIKNAIRREIR